MQPMSGFEGGGADSAYANSEQQSLLEGKAFSLRPLANAGQLTFWGVVQIALQPIAIFVWGLAILTLDLRAVSQIADLLIFGFGAAAGLIYPVIAFLVLLFGVVFSKLSGRVRVSAIVYWTWWPFWRLAMCLAAVILATIMANNLWTLHFYPNIRLQQLQGYQEIDPKTVPGIRLEDAGMVMFASSAGVDRTRTSCLKNGFTYCIAPVVRGGKVPNATQEKLVADPSDPNYPSYDFFVAGVDCCSCPGEFRCGDWDLPVAPGGGIGGLRVLDKSQNDMYQLAAQEWAVTYHKAMSHPIFFEWKQEPKAALKTILTNGNVYRLMAFFAVPVAFVLLTVLLNGLLKLLNDASLAAPLETPLPPPGLGRMLSSKFLPHMYKHYMDQQAQQQSWLGSSKYVVL